MNRLAVALAPLILAVSAFNAHAQDPHAGHVMPATPAPTRPAPDPVVRPQTPAGPAAQDPHAGHVMPPAQIQPAADPHAGHQMPAQPATVDPHAGHDMSTMAPPAQPDPHAGHDMSTMTPAQVDPHAGHDMSTMSMGPPDVPTSADNRGRPPEDSLPAAALGGPTHAADLVFGVGAMAASRRTLVRENGDVRTTAIIIDRLEAGFGDDGETWLWDVQGWSGGDINRLWWKSEGEGDFDDGVEEAELQALYSRAVTPFWDVQAGVRQDFRPDGEDTTHLVLGLQGLAPYWWEIDAAAFLSTEGDLTARVEAEYDQRITQRLILQPRLEIDASASDIPELEIGSGLSSVEAGLRLRYEFRKEFAPYVGVEWSRAFGDTADYIEARGGEADETRFVVGLKAWF
ncbi:copper resistance protein B [Brevundimonas sp.]|uniref:copper resistance protein B n=1 Tax=Brevundimonas sp. TaxID=1871086 RepID=UPI003F6FBABE